MRPTARTARLTVAIRGQRGLGPNSRLGRDLGPGASRPGGCYGCFGPVATPNVAALTTQLRRLGMTDEELDRVFATFNAASPALVAARRR
jgi:sulfhydrogenase subunit delta